MTTKTKTPSNLIELGPHESMTAEEALELTLREVRSGKIKQVIVVGYNDENDQLFSRSSEMSRQEANWMIDHAKLYALGVG